jgi:hypothetical protein
MAVSYDMTSPEMTRVTVRVPKTTLEQIGGWVDALGVRRSHFLGMALVAGSRLLVRSCSPETLGGALSALDEASLADGSSVCEQDASPFDGMPKAAPESVRTAMHEMQREIAALRAEVVDLREKLGSAEKHKKGRQQVETGQGGRRASAPSSTLE